MQGGANIEERVHAKGSDPRDDLSEVHRTKR